MAGRPAVARKEPVARTAHPRAAVMSVVAAFALAACGSGATRSAPVRPPRAGAVVGAAAGTKVRGQALAYARCMRDHGVDLADPTFGADGRPRFGSATSGTGTTPAARAPSDAARAACESTWPGMEGRAPRSPEELGRVRAALVAFAACMRGHGLDFPDPTFDRDGRPRLEPDPGATPEQGGHDTRFDAAAQACRDRIGDRPVMGAG